MMKTKRNIISVAVAVIVCGSVYARENVGSNTQRRSNVSRVMSNGCQEDIGAAFLQINNVRVRVMSEGDMWWDPGNQVQEYLVPKGGVASAEYAGSLWIGGLDVGGQLKISCMTYRQNGVDFWAGPLDTTTVSITPAECSAYDKLFHLTRQEVQNYVSNSIKANLTPEISNWPGNGNANYNEAHYLAPFIDINHDGIYEPDLGEYPAYDLAKNSVCNDQLFDNEVFGDETLWWVFNDEGNIHSETGGIPIGLEIQAQAFEFQTSDALNNATFYNYKIINRSSYTLNKTYFGVWDDFDIGNGANDYTGCDVKRSMGIGYNGTTTDPDGSAEPGYHDFPPAIGVVFFKGPVADKNDSSCYVHNGLIGMAHFMYYNNDFSVMGNPQNASHYYNYLRGLWTDQTQATYGGNGYQSSSTYTNYMFPWYPKGYMSGAPAYNTDQAGCGTNHIYQNAEWDEPKSVDPPGDRRFIESAGPFTLQAGAVNYVTTGVVWDQSITPDNNILPLGLIGPDADLAQDLFNNCFKVLAGPDAPDLTIQELNQEVVITMTNAPTSNNYKEQYRQKGDNIPKDSADSMYVFEGYLLYQVVDSSVTIGDLNNPSKVQLVAECDIKDGVGQIINYILNPSINTQVPTPTLEVNGADKGIVHSFDIKKDLFQIDNDPGLVNDRPYYFMAVAFAYNNYSPYNMVTGTGQKNQYLQGSHNIGIYKAIPHNVSAQNYGTIQNSNYGEIPQITRIEGHGNGNNVIELDQPSIDYILQNDSMAHPTYAIGQGPISVKVVDPLSVPAGNFVVALYPIPPKTTIDSTARWKAYIQGIGDTIWSDTNISYENEQIVTQWGISITVQNVDNPGYGNSLNNGAQDSSSTITFSNSFKPWLKGVQTASPGVNYQFWIRSGSFQDPGQNAGGTPDVTYNSLIEKNGTPNIYWDPNLYYQQMVGGTWGPYFLCSVSDPSQGLYCDNGPRFSVNDRASLAKLSSVDVVITSDKTKWTRCVVLEEQDDQTLAEGGALKLNPRNAPSIAKDGKTYATIGSGASTNPDQPNYISDKGMGWFPGYAINVETGERLNMAFGEDSWLVNDSGRDMKWNPDTVLVLPIGNGSSGVSHKFGIESIFGGKHYIYVFGHTGIAPGAVPIYDGGDSILHMLNAGNKTGVFADAMWVGIPLLAPKHNLLECDVTIRLRVAKPYLSNWGTSTNSHTLWKNNSPVNDNYPMYSFSTDGLEVETNNTTVAKNELDSISIVPNPYYAYSYYESDRIDTRVRITNLPPLCTISIFTLSGSLVNVINKEGPLTYIDWNLQNQYNVPVASGLYLIHVYVPNVGEKTLKWFGVMRPLDLNQY